MSVRQWSRLPAAPAVGLPRPATDAPAAGTSRLVERFILFQIACQLALILPIGGGRTLVRIASLGASLALLALVRGRGPVHPSRAPAMLVLGIVTLSILHPTSNTLLAAAAQAGMYLAILAPLFWVTRLRLDPATLRRSLLILWAFHSVSALAGVLQVYFPGSFQPNVSPVILAQGPGYVESLKIVTPSGVRVFRPMGLTDIPGGAGSAGFYAVLLGMGFFLAGRHRAITLLSGVTMLVGMTALYLSQVRALMAMALIGIMAVGGFLLVRRDVARAGALGAVLLLVLVAGYRGAVSMGGGNIAQRVATLTGAAPGQVYYSNRGHFLQQTVEELLPQYPFGAGMGRWGMMYGYFGDGSDPSTAQIHAEIQWTGWLLDGGVPLILAYLATLLLALRTTLRIAWSPPPRGGEELRFWAAVLSAHGVGALALTFSYPIFLSQMGMEFWLLNTALFTTAYSRLYPARPG